MFVSIGIAALTAGSANAQCPAVGADTNCGVVITILATGNTACPPQGCAVVSNNQGPYDTIDDTLVGVVNNSVVPITTLVLTSGPGGSDIFGFDGDGICGLSPLTGAPYVPSPPACPYGPTGYEGPGTSFSNISSDATTGTVTFSPPIAANGGTAYFSLENSLTQGTACSDAVNGSVPTPTGGSPTISTSFTPNLGYTIASAATLCGFTNFDWQQIITAWPTPSPLIPVSGTPPTLSAPPSFFDPPAGGGYTYELTNGYPTGDFAYPYYLNPNLNPGQTGQPELLANEPGGTSLLFSDTPTDPCLAGGNSQGVAGCNGKNAAPSAMPLQFQTHLVGLNSNGTYVDLGIGFNWYSNYNGTSGGTGTSKNLHPADPGSGKGGVTVTNVNEVTNYQYPKSLGVIGINGNTVTQPATTTTLLPGSEYSVRASGLAYSRVNMTFNGSVTVKNTSSSSLTGPFQLLFDSLTTGVTLTDATSTFGGWSFLTLPGAGSLTAGQSATAGVAFMDTGTAAVTFTPLVYTGGFN